MYFFNFYGITDSILEMFHGLVVDLYVIVWIEKIVQVNEN